jgi:hypothetical protein
MQNSYCDHRNFDSVDQTLVTIFRDAGTGGGAGGEAAPVALYQEGQGGQRCPFNLKDRLGEIAK